MNIILADPTRMSIECLPYIILDVMLPLKDGFEVCRELRAAGSTVPGLILTARDAVADRNAGLDFGNALRELERALGATLPAAPMPSSVSISSGVEPRPGAEKLRQSLLRLRLLTHP